MSVIFTLDYLPSEKHPYPLAERVVEISGRKILLLTDQQPGQPGHCHNLREDGRCGIHTAHAFTCDFELVRTLDFGHKAILTQKLYGRGWAMRRVDGNRGALCTMLPPSEDTIIDVVRKLRRLQGWAAHCGIATRIPQILEWVDSAPTSALLLTTSGQVENHSKLTHAPLPLRWTEQKADAT